MSRPYWTNARVTVYLADNREVLPQIEGVALTVTSPPYNVLTQGVGGRMAHAGRDMGAWAAKMNDRHYEDGLPEEEYRRGLSEVADLVAKATIERGSFFFNHKCRWIDRRLTTPAELAADWPAWRLEQEIIWSRPGAAVPGAHRFRVTDERILWLVKGLSPHWNNRCEGDGTVWTMLPAGNAGSRVDHPAPFPPELPWRAILSTTERDDLVLDPYAGSGTTLRAAQRLGRRAIGIENEERFCEEMVRLLEDA